MLTVRVMGYLSMQVGFHMSPISIDECKEITLERVIDKATDAPYYELANFEFSFKSPQPQQRFGLLCKKQ